MALFAFWGNRIYLDKGARYGDVETIANRKRYQIRGGSSRKGRPRGADTRQGRREGGTGAAGGSEAMKTKALSLIKWTKKHLFEISIYVLVLIACIGAAFCVRAGVQTMGAERYFKTLLRSYLYIQLSRLWLYPIRKPNRKTDVGREEIKNESKM